MKRKQRSDDLTTSLGGTSFLRPKKQLGQHFLGDPNITRKIITHCRLQPDETILEIGPGLGVLTRELAPKVKKVIAIETDKQLCLKLREQLKDQNIVIHHADFLKYDLGKLPRGLKAVGNLPYYISSPIIAAILKNRDRFRQLFCTVQLEFGKRLVAKPNCKDYSAFTCFVDYHADVKMLFKIKNTSFRPAPKVSSCFLQIDIRPAPRFSVNDEPLLFKTIHSAFQQRRKTILNALSPLMKKQTLQDIFEALELNPNLRAENLTLQNYAEIANAITDIQMKR